MYKVADCKFSTRIWVFPSCLCFLKHWEGGSLFSSSMMTHLTTDNSKNNGHFRSSVKVHHFKSFIFPSYLIPRIATQRCLGKHHTFTKKRYPARFDFLMFYCFTVVEVISILDAEQQQQQKDSLVLRTKLTKSLIA